MTVLSVSSKEIPNSTISSRLGKFALNEYKLRGLQNWVIFGIRGVQFDSDTVYSINNDQINKFNDCVILIKEGMQSLFFDATLDPGMPWIRNPMSVLGCARLNPGMYIYKRGLHKNIPALVQASKVSVTRDRNRDGVWQKTEPSETGYFGINIHPRFSSGDVGNNSAGCTVIDSLPTQRTWRNFIDVINLATQNTFPYIVIDQDQIIDIINSKE